MDPVYAALLPLAALELEERRLSEVVRQAARKLQAAEEAASGAAARVVAVRQALGEHRRAVGPLEAEMAALDARRRRAQEALDNGAIDEAAGRRQVELLVAGASALEDQALDHLEAVDRLTGELASAEAAAAQAASAWTDAQAAWVEPRAQAERAFGDVRARIAGVIEGLPPADRDAVAGCRARKGTATAAADDGVCAGCHTAMPVGKRGELKQGRVVTCAGCGRWLVVSVPAFNDV